MNFKTWNLFILNAIAPLQPDSVLDLGCGTGELLYFFPNQIKKSGLDKSEEMIKVASQRNPQAKLYHGNINSFELNQSFDLITCTHDTVNYLLEDGELDHFFYHVAKHLKQNGYFFFDVNSEYNLQNNFHGKLIKERWKNVFFEWYNEYDSIQKLIHSRLVFKIKDENTTKTLEETHTQRYYSNREIEASLKRNNLKVLKKGSDYESWDVSIHSSLINYLIVKY